MPGRQLTAEEAQKWPAASDPALRACLRVLVDDEGEDVLDDNDQKQYVLAMISAEPTP